MSQARTGRSGIAPSDGPPAVGRGTRAVAVIGAGIAGLAAARTLGAHGFDVRVFERGRGPGGRTAHRRTGAHCFDHGAQYFTARDARFAGHCNDWLAAGVIAPWHGRIVSLGAARSPAPTSPLARYVGVPGMNAVAKHLAERLDLVTGCTVTALSREGDAWRVHHEAMGAEPFDAVVLAMPPEQALRLVPAAYLAVDGAATRSQPCWCAMAAFDAALPVGFDGAFVDSDTIGWAARDSSKPGRPAGERWVIHATPGWSAERLDAPPQDIAHALLDHLFDALRVEPRPASYLAGHRWALARPAGEMQIDCVWHAERGLALCGDWCRGGRVEGAFLSGVAAARRIVAAAADHQGIG